MVPLVNETIGYWYTGEWANCILTNAYLRALLGIDLGLDEGMQLCFNNICCSPDPLTQTNT